MAQLLVEMQRMVRRPALASEWPEGQLSMILGQQGMSGLEKPVAEAPADKRVARLLEHVQRHLHEDHSLDTMAEKTAMSRRTFTRHFRQLTGSSFGDWLPSQRLAEAQRLLETTQRPLERIAADIGLGSPVTLRQHFQRAYRTSPASYRRTFSAPRE